VQLATLNISPTRHRFFIHKTIQSFAAAILEKHGNKDEGAMLFPTHITASRCRDFIIRTAADSDTSRVRIVDLVPVAEKARTKEMDVISPKISAVLYPLELFKVAKQFWQHSGDGVSSRRAEYCQHLFENGVLVDAARLNGAARTCKGPRRYQKPTSIDLGTPDAVQDGETLTQFVEQRFGRNLDLSMTKNAKLAVRRRIAGSLTADVALAEALSLDKDSSRARQVAGFSEDDVYLYPTGMSSIYNTHRNLLAAKGSRKAIVYG
jgi:cystathionine gamma-synthase